MIVFGISRTSPKNFNRVTRFPAIASIHNAATKNPNKAIGADMYIGMLVPSSYGGAYRKMRKQSTAETTVAISIKGNPPKRNRCTFNVIYT